MQVLLVVANTYSCNSLDHSNLVVNLEILYLEHKLLSMLGTCTCWGLSVFIIWTIGVSTCSISSALCEFYW